ncbi:uncharacterized protein ATC70_002802 [Mucor velutinosus]|uniref:Secreted protein n=1 Tax=Mucor velutinosus TaxID=708070 RepID=A0AAN7DD02_9FUNG|nr:hypothetical protein ATC70_002802 [Mucor velutinosus]
MRVVSQLFVALALTSCMIQISQALPTTDNMVMKRDGLPLVGDLLGGALGGGDSRATNVSARPAGQRKKNKMGNNKVHPKKGSMKQNNFKKVKKVKKAKKAKHATTDTME